MYWGINISKNNKSLIVDGENKDIKILKMIVMNVWNYKRLMME